MAALRYESARSMRIRYQVKGLCTKECTLAHVVMSKLSNKNKTDITAKLRLIYTEVEAVNCRRVGQI